MADDLWRFALTLYARPGVEAACLDAQARGADVCLLLAGAWLGRRGVDCDPQRVAALKALTRPWRDSVVAPLRGLRQGWRDAARDDPELAALRERVKALELEAERVLLQRLAHCADDWPADVAGDATDAVVRTWLEALAGDAASSAAQALDDLRRAVPET